MIITNKRYEAAVPIGDICPHPRNPRQGDVGAIVQSIDNNGFYGACVVQQSTGYILVGSHRHQAAAHSGATTIPVIYVDVDDRGAIDILLSDNRTNDLATYDEPALAALLREMQHGEGLEGTGFDGDALDNILEDLTKGAIAGAPNAAAAADPEPGQEKVAPEDRYNTPKTSEADATSEQVDHGEELRTKWNTKPGQVWLIGAHRLMCGDSRSDADVKRLLAGRMVQAMWTDPPYGVNYVGKTKNALTIQNDGADELPVLLEKCFRAADANMVEGAPFYVAHPHGPLSLEFGKAVLAVGWRWHETLVWVKDSMVLGHSDYHYKHEPVLYGWKGKNRPWYGERTKVTVLEFPKPSRSELHPTTKPTGLIRHCLENSTAAGDLVYEPFSGSGATLIACQETGRVGCAMEIDPRYVAVGLERLSLMGLVPELEAETA